METLFRRPPAGLSTVERSRSGSPSARDLVIKAVTEEKPPAGLSLAEMARLGLKSAKEKVEIIYEAAGITEKRDL